jgi:hypothetical protein
LGSVTNFPVSSRHAGSVAAHRGFAATFASARPSCRLSNRHNSSDDISAVIEIPLQQIKSFKAEQEWHFFRAKGGEKNRTGRVCLSVTSEQQE